MPVDPMLAAAQAQAHAASLQVVVAGAQAILTLIALAIAIGIPVWQDKRNAAKKGREKFIESRELANVILPAVKDWSFDMARLASRARNGLIEDVYHRYESAFSIPEAIASKVGELHLLGEAALPLQDAIYQALGSRREWDEYVDAARGNLVDKAAELAIQRGHEATYKMRALLVISTTAIESLFDGSYERFGQQGDRPWNYRQEVDDYVLNDMRTEAKVKAGPVDAHEKTSG